MAKEAVRGVGHNTVKRKPHLDFCNRPKKNELVCAKHSWTKLDDSRGYVKEQNHVPSDAARHIIRYRARMKEEEDETVHAGMRP